MNGHLPVQLLLAVSLAAAWPGDRPTLPVDSLPAELVCRPPYGLLHGPQPEHPPIEAAHARVGRELFFDAQLSIDRSVSCASCHQPAHGFAQPSATSPGVRGQRTTRNAPALFNRALGQRFMWDGRVATLLEQVLMPIENPSEMGLGLDELIGRLAGDAHYALLFQSTYGAAPSRDLLAESLASFVQTIWLGDSPVDHFQAGDAAALTEEERTGLWIYESKGACWRCHSGVNFSDESFHNTGIGVQDGLPEAGRFAITGDETDRGRFKTPTLRGVALSAPYMHDGSLASLADVVAFYRRGGNANSNQDEILQPIELSDEEARRLVKFLEALSRQVPAQTPR